MQPGEGWDRLNWEPANDASPALTGRTIGRQLLIAGGWTGLGIAGLVLAWKLGAPGWAEIAILGLWLWACALTLNLQLEKKW